jgi:hypothetical protein
VVLNGKKLWRVSELRRWVDEGACVPREKWQAKKGAEDLTDREQLTDEGKTKNLEPLTKKARRVYEKLCSLKVYEAMTTPELQDWYYETYQENLDEGTFKDIRKELIPYGVENKPRVGYFIRK